MNLINEKVKHAEYGTGVIVDLEDNKLYVKFDSEYGQKKFIFPDAFDHFLELDNSDFQDEISELIRMKMTEDTLEKQKKWHALIKRQEDADIAKKKEKEELARQKKRQNAIRR